MSTRAKTVLVGTVMTVTVLAAGGSLMAGAYLGSKLLMVSAVALYALALTEFGCAFYYTFNNSDVRPLLQSPYRPNTANTAPRLQSQSSAPTPRERNAPAPAVWDPQADRKVAYERRNESNPYGYHSSEGWGTQFDVEFNPFDCNCTCTNNAEGRALVISTLVGIALGVTAFGVSYSLGVGFLPAVCIGWFGVVTGLVSSDYMQQLPNHQYLGTRREEWHRPEEPDLDRSRGQYRKSMFEQDRDLEIALERSRNAEADEKRNTEGERKESRESAPPSPPPHSPRTPAPAAPKGRTESAELSQRNTEAEQKKEGEIKQQTEGEIKQRESEAPKAPTLNKEIIHDANNWIRTLNSVNYTAADRRVIEVTLASLQPIWQELRKVINSIEPLYNRKEYENTLVNLNFAIVKKLWKPLCTHQFENKIGNRRVLTQADVKDAMAKEDVVVLQNRDHNTTLGIIPSLELSATSLSGYDALFFFARHCNKQSLCNEDTMKFLQAELPTWAETIWADRTYISLEKSIADKTDITKIPTINIDDLTLNEVRWLIGQFHSFENVRGKAYYIVDDSNIYRENEWNRYQDSGLPILLCVNKVWQFIYCTKIEAATLDETTKPDSLITIGTVVKSAVVIKYANNLRNSLFSDSNKEKQCTRLDKFVSETYRQPQSTYIGWSSR